MKISEAIAKLEEIKVKFGDIAITGGQMVDDVPLKYIIVTDKNGVEVWPYDESGGESNPIDGVFLI